ncbi:MAG: GatB/YqeY domain-containing protein [Janthinobacterium lividum]
MREQLPTLMKEAMKAGQKQRLGAIRLIQAAMKDREIEARGLGKEMTGEDEQAVLRKMLKQRQDSIVAYEGAGREELAAQERAEVEVLQEFLPQQMDEAETRAAIAAAIAETGAAGPKDMGKVIAAVKAKHAGQIDFGKASGIVKEMLAKLG